MNAVEIVLIVIAIALVFGSEAFRKKQVISIKTIIILKSLGLLILVIDFIMIFKLI